MRETGIYEKIGAVEYFIPHALPPYNPPLSMTPGIIALYGQARAALGELNAVSRKQSDRQRLIRAYVTKEALLSSAIEGIHTTLIEVFTHQLGDEKPSKNTQLVLNYINALDEALSLLYEHHMPLVSRVLLATHAVLMSAGAGDQSSPGQFRKQSVRVGNLVPPVAPRIPQLMSDLEQYINQPEGDLPPLIKAGLAHIQFETIHPFLDGNGRIGRILIVLMMMQDNLLTSPILYPSYYFKKHHALYYQKLDRVRTHGDFEGWIVYYLTAIRDSAADAYQRALDITTLEETLITTIKTDPLFKRTQDTALTILRALFEQPIATVADLSRKTNRAYNTVQKILTLLRQATLVTETIVHTRNKVYHFTPYLAVLEKDYSNE